MKKPPEVLLEVAGEGALLLVVAALGWAARQPLVFASLGPTAYEQVAKPHDASAHLRNVVLGHLIGLAAGFAALALFDAWGAPKVMQAGFVPGVRIWAVAVSVALTTGGTLVAKARQPAATSTALLVSLGAMQTARDAMAIIAGVVLIGLLGEPVRRLRARQTPRPKA